VAHQPPERTRDWPLWHFARLEAALDRGDRRSADQALRDLERLGIEVRFRLPRLPATPAAREEASRA
jgi:hypothetical protein